MLQIEMNVDNYVLPITRCFARYLDTNGHRVFHLCKHFLVDPHGNNYLKRDAIHFSHAFAEPSAVPSHTHFFPDYVIIRFELLICLIALL